MMASVSVVLPEDSGPKISITLPRGMPPTPSAMSRPNEPDGIESTSYVAPASPKRITEPLPNCFSIWLSAAASAFLRFSSMGESLDKMCRHYFIFGARRSSHMHRNDRVYLLRLRLIQ